MQLDERNKRRLVGRPEWISDPELYEAILAILFAYDPIGICDGGNPRAATEYAAEVDTIFPQLRAAHSVLDMQRIIHAEFTRWFGATAGPIEKYSQIASEVWKIYRDKHTY